MRTQLLKAGLTALAITGLLILPMHEAEAVTRCRETIVNGRVVQRICNSVPRYRTVCNTYWRHGMQYRDCRRIVY